MTRTLLSRRAILLAGTLASIATTTLDARTRSHRPVAHRTVHQAMRAPVGTRVIAPTTEMVMSPGRGRVVSLTAEPAFLWSSAPGVVSIVVSPESPRQIQLQAVAPGEATVYAKSRSGAILWSAAIRVGVNANTLDQMLRMAMPDAHIVASQMNGLVLLTGTIGAPDDAVEAERLVKAYMGANIEVVTRLRAATPLQVMLRVRIAEVSRSLAKSINSSLVTNNTGTGINIAQGRNLGSFGTRDYTGYPTRDFSSQFGFPAGTLPAYPFDPANPGTPLNPIAKVFTEKLGAGTGTTSIALLGRLFGIDTAAAFDLAETDGLVTLLAEPNLTALSGETASFLAGGEFPIPQSSGFGQVSVDYKQYGVSLAFTPTVLADGRISMRVRPEVSQLSSQGAVTLNGYTIPAVTTRRTETTVELGSGQSFVIGGLLQNNNNNSIQKAPGLGDVPVLGALFRSNGYQRNQTELMIVVTPYLVRPVDSADIVLPTDGLQNPTDLEAALLGKMSRGRPVDPRTRPQLAPPVTVAAPSVGAALIPPPPAPATAPPAAVAMQAPVRETARPARSARGGASAAAMPGFSN